METGCFYVVCARDKVSSIEFCTGGCVRKAEESPLLEAVAREWLEKTRKAGKDLAWCVVICELWRLAAAL
jgi:hypothetical protein